MTMTVGEGVPVGVLVAVGREGVGVLVGLPVGPVVGVAPVDENVLEVKLER